MRKALISIRNLYLNFRTFWGISKVLNGVDFDIFEGEVFGLVGETGCGKSVTAMSILRLLPSSADILGEVIFKGKNLLLKSDDEMRKIRGKEISMVFQDPMTSLNPLFRIGEQMVDVITAHTRIEKEEALDRARELLKSVRLPDPDRVLFSYPHELSGGMRQRVMIAMALSCRPSLLIADEPTTALDVTVQKSVLELMLELKEKYGFPF